MTRISPKPSISRRRSRDDAAIDLSPVATGAESPRESQARVDPIVLRWRLRRKGSLVLTLTPWRAPDGRSELEADALVEIEASGTPGAEPRELRGSARIARVGGELEIALRFSARTASAPDELSAGLTMVSRGDGAGVLLLSDLPARLGLQGGTYALCEPSGVDRWIALGATAPQ